MTPAERLAIKVVKLLNKFEGANPRNMAYLQSCCCDEELVITDGTTTYRVDSIFNGDPENGRYTWKAVERV
jgi:hypothetical protein